MKMTAIALPILLAATFSLPSQAADVRARLVQGNFVLSLSSGDSDSRFERVKRQGKRGDRTAKSRKNRQTDAFEPVYLKPLSPRRIIRKLSRRGYSDFARMTTNGKVYKLRARGRKGNLVRLMVDARTGEVLHRKVIRRYYRANAPAAVYGWHDRTGSRRIEYQLREPFWMR